MLCIFNFITTRRYLIGVTTKDEFWINLGRKGKTLQPYLLQHDEEEDDDLEKCHSVWTDTTTHI